MATNTLKNTKWIVTHENSGSRGILTLNGDTTGTFTVSPNTSPVVWGENWDNGNCALWVVFKDMTDQNRLRIWGIVTNMTQGNGMSAFGNSNPQDPTNTSFQNEGLSMVPAP